MKHKMLPHRSTPPLAIFAAVLMLIGTILASEPKATVLHRFRSADDGRAAYARVISDAAGNLYGTTTLGGTAGVGTVFELTKPQAPGAWTETVLYTFAGLPDGSQPYGGLIFDSAGNLYGTTCQGGTSDAGIVYQLAPPVRQDGAWTENILYSFDSNNGDGICPQGDLIFDQAGNLYGTTYEGGPGVGTVFKLAPPTVKGGAWTQTILHGFGGSEGTSPRAAVIFDREGSLYGTLYNNGAFGAGAVFQLKPPPKKGGSWTETTLYSFTAGADGFNPSCRLVFLKGSLYGTTVFGGTFDAGIIFQLTPPADHNGAWTESVLHIFKGGSDGSYPWAGLIVDKKGILYGTTQYGGPSNGGTVFEMKQDGGSWTESVLYSFTAIHNQLPVAGLLFGKGGTLYGTTIGNTKRAGMVFKLHP